MTVFQRAGSLFLCDCAHQLVGVAWFDTALRAQFEAAWRWVLAKPKPEPANPLLELHLNGAVVVKTTEREREGVSI